MTRREQDEYRMNILIASIAGDMDDVLRYCKEYIEALENEVTVTEDQL